MAKFEFNLFIRKNVIITFDDWQSSRAKKDVDLLYSKEKFKPTASPVLNFIFTKDGPALVWLFHILDDFAVFFDHRKGIFYIRQIEDISNITLYTGQFVEYLKNNKDQKENPPSLNLVFKDDPSGVFGSLDANQRCISNTYLLQKIFALNLIMKNSKLVDQDFYNLTIQVFNIKTTSEDEFNEKIINGVLEHMDYSYYNLLLKRGVLFGDYEYVKNVANETLKPRWGLW